jgi:hypothetical protein
MDAEQRFIHGFSSNLDSASDPLNSMAHTIKTKTIAKFLMTGQQALFLNFFSALSGFSFVPKSQLQLS